MVFMYKTQSIYMAFVNCTYFSKVQLENFQCTVKPARTKAENPKQPGILCQPDTGTTSRKNSRISPQQIKHKCYLLKHVPKLSGQNPPGWEAPNSLELLQGSDTLSGLSRLGTQRVHKHTHMQNTCTPKVRKKDMSVRSFTGFIFNKLGNEKDFPH